MSPPSGGYFLLYRSLLEPDHHLAEGPVCPRFAWVDLIGLATHVAFQKSVKMNLVQLQRGEFIASLRFLAKRWEWSKNRVARFLHVLEVRGQLRTVSETPGGTVYRVVNYDTYQKPWDSERDTEGTAEGQPRDSQGTNTIHSNSHQFTEEADPQVGIFPESEVPTNGQAMKPNQLLAEWIKRQPLEPDGQEKGKQAGKAKQICSKHSRMDIIQAFNGMGQLFPYSEGEPWDLFDLDRKFTKAKQAVMNHPQVQGMKRKQELAQELEGI
jgi:hypothetical protein